MGNIFSGLSESKDIKNCGLIYFFTSFEFLMSGNSQLSRRRGSLNELCGGEIYPLLLSQPEEIGKFTPHKNIPLIINALNNLQKV